MGGDLAKNTRESIASTTSARRESQASRRDSRLFMNPLNLGVVSFVSRASFCFGQSVPRETATAIRQTFALLYDLIVGVAFRWSLWGRCCYGGSYMLVLPR